MTLLPWVSDVEVVLNRSLKEDRKDTLVAVTDPLNEKCVVEEFLHLRKVVAFYCFPGRVDVVDASPNSHGELIGSVSFPFSTISDTIMLSALSTCDSNVTKDLSMCPTVHLCLVFKEKERHWDLYFFNFEFAFTREGDGREPVVESMRVVGHLGSVDEKSSGSSWPLCSNFQLLDGSFSVYVEEWGAASACHFALPASGEPNSVVVRRGETETLDNVQHLSSPTFSTIDIDERWSSQSGSYERTVQYLQSLLPLRGLRSSDSASETRWSHLSSCRYNVAPSVSGHTSDSLGLLTYSVKLRDISTGSDDSLCTEPCDKCGSLRKPSYTTVPRLTEVLAWNSFQSLRDRKNRRIPLKIMFQLESQYEPECTIGSDNGEDTCLQSPDNEGSSKKRRYCVECVTSSWTAEACSLSLLAASPSGATVCLYRPQLMFPSDFCAERNATTAPWDGDDCGLWSENINIPGEYILFRRRGDAASLVNEKTSSQCAGLFREIRRFVVPYVSQRSHPEYIKLTDEAVWIVYSWQPGMQNNNSVYRVAIQPDVELCPTSLNDGTPSLSQKDRPHAEIMENNLASYGFETRRASGTEKPGRNIHGSEVLTLPDTECVASYQQLKSECASPTALMRMDQVLQKCSPYALTEASATSARGCTQYLANSQQSNDITEVFQLSHRQYIQHKSDICARPDVLLELLRIVMDDLELHPYDQTQMTYITEALLSCVTDLLISRANFFISSCAVEESAIFRAAYTFLVKASPKAEGIMEEKNLNKLMELVLVTAVQNAASEFGVMGPQAIASGAAVALSILWVETSPFYALDRKQVFLSSVYQMVSVAAPRYLPEVEEAALKPTQEGSHLRSCRGRCGDARLLLFGPNRHITTIVPITNILDIWNTSLSIWLTCGAVLEFTSITETTLLQQVTGDGAGEWLVFLATKLLSYIHVPRSVSETPSEASAVVQASVTLERAVVLETLQSLYIHMGNREHDPEDHRVNGRLSHESPQTLQKLWDIVAYIDEQELSPFPRSTSSLPRSIAFSFDKKNFYEVLSHLASLCSGAVLQGLPALLIELTWFLNSLLTIPKEWNLSRALLEEMDVLLDSEDSDPRRSEPFPDDTEPLKYHLCVAESDVKKHLRDSLVFFGKACHGSLYFQLASVRDSAFMLLYFTWWLRRNLSSTLRRFETVSQASKDPRENDTKNDPFYGPVWWDLRVGAGSGGTSVAEGLTLGSSGQLSQDDLKRIVDIETELRVKFALVEIIVTFVMDSNALECPKTLNRIVNDAMTYLPTPASTDKNAGNEIILPTSAFLSPSVIFEHLVTARAWKAGVHLCSKWIRWLPGTDNEGVGTTGGTLYYLKGFCEGFLLRNTQLHCKKESADGTSWIVAVESLCSALQFDRWMLYFDAYRNDKLMATKKSGDAASPLSEFISIKALVGNPRSRRAKKDEKTTQNLISDSSTSLRKRDSGSIVLNVFCGSVVYCIQCWWICEVMRAPGDIRVQLLKRAAEYLDRLEEEMDCDVTYLQQAREHLWEYIFYNLCKYCNERDTAGAKQAVVLLVNCPYIASSANQRLLELMETQFYFLEDGHTTVEDVLDMLGSLTDVNLFGLLLTYLARLTFLIPPASIRARFAMQIFQNLLVQRVKGHYEAPLHCVILAALLQLRLIELNNKEDHYNLLSSFFAVAEGIEQFPPNLLYGLSCLLRGIPKCNASAKASGIWTPLLRLVPQTRGIGPDAIELLNIQKNYLRSAITHLDANSRDHCDSLLLPSSYFGVTILQDPPVKVLEPNQVVPPPCIITRKALVSLDMLAVLKLELLATLNRHFSDAKEISRHQDVVIYATVRRLAELLASAGLLQKAVWCVRTWEFLRCEPILLIFLQAFMAERYGVEDESRRGGSKGNYRVLTQSTTQEAHNFSVHAEPRKRRRNVSETPGFGSLNADARHGLTNERNGNVEYSGSAGLNGTGILLSSAWDSPNTVRLPFTLCTASTSDLWKCFTVTVDTLYKERHTLATGFDLQNIFHELISYIGVQNVHLPDHVLNWIFSHPYHENSLVPLLQDVLECCPKHLADQLVQRFLVEKMAVEGYSPFPVIRIPDLLWIDERLSASSRDIFRAYVRNKFEQS